ncbi:MAG: nicotinate-nucleotide adenylyltransferase [Tissierellia bacterium]|nr:nicotinate-nucleotide adenylyltransferase [Tissierellia bacterium]
MRVGIFGGTFNPIHMGHLIIAEHILDAAQLDKIIFIPAQSPPHKSLSLTDSAEHRYEMVRLAISGNSRFEISDIELKRNSKSYSVETVRELKKVYPNDKLFFIIGSDTFYELGTWFDLPGILEIVEFLVVRRPGYIDKYINTLDQAMEDFAIIHGVNISLVDAPLIQISSTLIRDKYENGASIRYLVPENVMSFIGARGLYE